MTFGLSIALAASLALTAAAQNTQNMPATDSAAQASPIRPAPPAPVTDAAQQASPVPLGVRAGVWIAPHTAIDIKLGRSIDSGRLKNGESVPASLTKPVTLSPHGLLNPGTPVQLTVLETLPAGRISAAGEFSLQLERVGSLSVFTDTLTYRGKPGHKDLPDSAPQVGTDAGLAAGAELTFHVLPPPAPASAPPRANNRTPGSVNGTAVGGPPPPGSSAMPNNAGAAQSGTAGSKPGSGNTNPNARQVIPASNTPQPAERVGQPSPAPNQPASPNTNSTQSTQPHP